MHFIDEDLIEGCKAQIPKYQKALVLKYSALLMGTAMRYCRDEIDAEDCVQESWIKILGAIRQYQPTGSFTAWMQRITINCALTMYRKRASVIRMMKSQPETNEDIAPQVYSDLEYNHIMNMLNELSEAKRLVFTLYVVDGYSHKEIGELLHITESSSRANLTRARQEMKEKITQHQIQTNHGIG